METNNQRNSTQTADSPIDNLTYDVITVIHEKAKGLEAYEKYMRDAGSNQEVSQLFQQIRQKDEESVQHLRDCLQRLLGGQQGERTSGTTMKQSAAVTNI